ncbi:MAG: chromosome partitioning protein MukE, partial [Vibrio sp.]|nr:chromosome partitioning protein MukE [Vibrio sp.]
GDTNKFRISEAVFRFGADVRIGDDMREAQLRLIRDGEAVVHAQEPNQGSLLDNEDEIEEQNVNEQTEWEGEA